ncbi:50S ribosomal protein L19e [Candidatus Gugararchaeum adminiculabundum]|nr:50S ribosomal protein L19e [Candidatus Gugararchaeum adminiculabundum]
MSLTTVKRIASDLLGIGESRIRISPEPEQTKRAAEALTRDDIRGLIDEGIVYTLPTQGVSRGRARHRHLQQKKGRQRGHGTHKGEKYSIVSKKQHWMQKVRSQRSILFRLKEQGLLADGIYRIAYLMIKGAAFKSKGAMLVHFKEKKWLTRDITAAEIQNPLAAEHAAKKAKLEKPRNPAKPKQTAKKPKEAGAKKEHAHVKKEAEEEKKHAKKDEAKHEEKHKK